MLLLAMVFYQGNREQTKIHVCYPIFLTSLIELFLFVCVSLYMCYTACCVCMCVWECIPLFACVAPEDIRCPLSFCPKTESLLHQPVLAIPFLHPTPSTGVIGVCAAMSGFSCGCWGLESRSSSLFSKCSYSLIHFSSP